MYINSNFCPVNTQPPTFNNVKSVFENVVKNGLKSHKKDKKTVFDILGVCYKQMSANVKFAA
ncbi:hypothetical protein KPL35_15430 [Clostridium sp. CF011]|uniref:hypothetical protein n=1 Tax=Clostridium sp. CF011 TaxID=2843318 RepID=UPI001C0B6F8F|nr:hypothetical protein [Clostridium sp. CF011]MBU3093454.1 hypothetical protein [Clostridium sp. CF011]WAG68759.1 hypothetical protein LL036_11710 [Clostridium sp. CF011]